MKNIFSGIDIDTEANHALEILFKSPEIGSPEFGEYVGCRQELAVLVARGLQDGSIQIVDNASDLGCIGVVCRMFQYAFYFSDGVYDTVDEYLHNRPVGQVIAEVVGGIEDLYHDEFRDEALYYVSSLRKRFETIKNLSVPSEVKNADDDSEEPFAHDSDDGYIDDDFIHNMLENARKNSAKIRLESFIRSIRSDYCSKVEKAIERLNDQKALDKYGEILMATNQEFEKACSFDSGENEELDSLRVEAKKAFDEEARKAMAMVHRKMYDSIIEA